MNQTTLLSELQSIVGKKHAREPKDDRDCAVDGLPPKAILEPGTYDEVAQVLRFANTERLAVIPRGGGTQMHLGNTPSRYDIALSLARLDKVTELEPADLTVTCQAGVSLGALHTQLAQSAQMAAFALEPDSAEPLTVGGLLALNSSDLRAAYGSPRDFTIGLRVVTADGRLSRTGGKVVKNVAGYDLCKLYIGSRGTLAVIVEATFKVFPRPRAIQTRSFTFSSCRDACAAALQAQAAGLGVADAYIVRIGYLSVKEDPYVLHLTLAGEPATIEQKHKQAQQFTGRASGQPLGTSQPHTGSAPFDQRDRAEYPLSVRTRLLPSQVPAFIEATEAWSAGLLHAAPLLGEVTWIWVLDGDQHQWVDKAMTTTRGLGGHTEILLCPPELKRQIDVFGPPPPSFPLMRAIKQQFDPNNVLSPGRFVGRL